MRIHTQIISSSAVLLSAALLSGCVAVWGKSYNIALANSRSVVIEYDPTVVNLPSLLGAAQGNCEKYGKDAVLHSVSSGNLGIKVNTFRCETRTADKVIDIQ